MTDHVSLLGALDSTNLTTIFQILGVNLVLSGDNAVVIALAARALPQPQRRWAVLGGVSGGILLRVVLTVAAARLLLLPYLQSLGGLILLFVAWRLVGNHEHSPPEEPSASAPATGHSASPDSRIGLRRAVSSILVADLVMSMDNVLSLAALSHGNWVWLIFGLVTSIPLIALSSELLLRLMQKAPIMILLAGGLLGHVAVTMIFSDPAWLSHHVQVVPLLATLLPWCGAGALMAGGWLSRSRTSK